MTNEDLNAMRIGCLQKSIDRMQMEKDNMAIEMEELASKYISECDRNIINEDTIKVYKELVTDFTSQLKAMEEKLMNCEYSLNEERNESYAKDLEILCLKAQLYDLLHPVA